MSSSSTCRVRIIGIEGDPTVLGCGGQTMDRSRRIPTGNFDVDLELDRCSNPGLRSPALALVQRAA